MAQYIFLACCLQFAFAVVEAQDCTCKSFVPRHFQPRGIEKVAKGQKCSNTKPEIIDVSYIYAWQRKYKHATDKLVWNDFKKRSKRSKNTPEDTIYRLKGYLWLVKKESFDCDYHIEIGPRDSSATRIVVEIPHLYVDLQKKVQLELLKRHLPLLYCTTHNERRPTLKKGYQ